MQVSENFIGRASSSTCNLGLKSVQTRQTSDYQIVLRFFVFNLIGFRTGIRGQRIFPVGGEDVKSIV
nr:MAG TPA: hypothetical protein [Caudoviricetes sp.]